MKTLLSFILAILFTVSYSQSVPDLPSKDDHIKWKYYPAIEISSPMVELADVPNNWVCKELKEDLTENGTYYKYGYVFVGKFDMRSIHNSIKFMKSVCSGCEYNSKNSFIPKGLDVYDAESVYYELLLDKAEIMFSGYFSYKGNTGHLVLILENDQNLLVIRYLSNNPQE